MRGPAHGRAASFRGRPPDADHSILSYCGGTVETTTAGRAARSAWPRAAPRGARDRGPRRAERV